MTEFVLSKKEEKVVVLGFSIVLILPALACMFDATIIKPFVLVDYQTPLNYYVREIIVLITRMIAYGFAAYIGRRYFKLFITFVLFILFNFVSLLDFIFYASSYTPVVAFVIIINAIVYQFYDSDFYTMLKLLYNKFVYDPNKQQ